MPKSRPAYPPEYRRRIVDLVRAGRTPESLAKEFEASAVSIRKWARQASIDEGQRTDGLTSDEKQELQRLRRENRVLREEKEILKKAAAWFAKGDHLDPVEGVQVREGKPGLPPCSDDVPCAGCLPQRLLRLDGALAVEPG